MDQKKPDPTLVTEVAAGAQNAAEERPSLAPESHADITASDPAWRMRHERYTTVRTIGRGGMSEVLLVKDNALQRFVAMKVLPWEGSDSAKARQRFIYEMRTTAALEHPGIVSVHDSGELPDGRLWFTMKEVRGVTLRQAINELHQGKSEKWTLRRLVEVLARVSEAVAYAHSRSVVHRDIKPENLMIGEFGEVLVMDWGLMKNLRGQSTELVREAGAELDSIDGFSPEEESFDSYRTMAGEIMGTPAYMAPEQARGDVSKIGPATDVYALGAVLYEILCGKPPYTGSSRAVAKAMRDGVFPQPIDSFSNLRFVPPPELVQLAKLAMMHKSEERFPNAGVFGAEVRAWLDGANKRERALALVEEAGRLIPKLENLAKRADGLEAEAHEILGALKPYSSVTEKAKGWALENAARDLRREAALEEVEWLQKLQAALNEMPDLPEAHEMLAEHYRARLVVAEQMREQDKAAQYEALLRAHDRGKYSAFLSGKATLSLVTDPAGAQVSLYRYIEIDRVFVPEYEGELGRTPLREVSISKGSYLLKVRAPGYQELCYPILVGRGEHWSGVAPGETTPRPIRMFRSGELSPDEVYVPAGWFIAGGDPEASESIPRAHLWANGLVVSRYPVTNREYLEYVNDLVLKGRADEAQVRVPRRRPESDSTPLFERDQDGQYTLVAASATLEEELVWPVICVDWHDAMGYAAWYADKTGKPWRLLNELEWEKAARGVDGRFAPWGDHIDPAFANMAGSTLNPSRVKVTELSTDRSPYGVCGVAGNVRDWCGNVWMLDGPDVRGGILQTDMASSTDPEPRAVRGGAWSSAPVFCRLAARFADKPSSRFLGVGIRLARSV